MRTLNQLEIVQDTNAKYPFGSTVKNETEINEGTPIVSEYIGDIIQNLYKLVSLAEITPTGIEDSDITQYQIVEALKKLPNDLNDVEQVLSLDADVWSVPFNLSILPNKYFFLAKASENYNSSITYTFKGTGETEYSFASQGFVSGDELLIIINNSGVIAYNLTKASSAAQDISTTLGTPLAYNDSNKMWYQDNGKIFSDNPDIYDLQSVIRTDGGDSTIIVNDMFIIKNRVLCFCLIPSTNLYFFRQFNLSDLTTSSSVTIVGSEIDDVSDFVPYVYAFKNEIYITNDMNISSEDFVINKFNFNPLTSTLTFVSKFNLDYSFVKTTNVAIKNGLLYTMVSGVLNSFNLTTGAKLSLGNYPSVAGQLFGFDDGIYFTSGEIAKKWNL